MLSDVPSQPTVFHNMVFLDDIPESEPGSVIDGDGAQPPETIPSDYITVSFQDPEYREPYQKLTCPVDEHPYDRPSLI